MIRRLVVVVVLIALATVLVSLSSCGRDQQLESISIQPASETFGASNIQVIANAGAEVQLRALGNYIHPPVTKDITSKVTWNSNTPQMMTVDSSGLLTVTGLACGTTLVSATVNTNSSDGGISSSGAIVTGYMTGNVVCFTSSGGGGGNPALTLTFQGLGSGAVSSSPLGLSCSSPGPCVTQSFPIGTPVTLTATPAGTSSFGSWSGCDSPGTTNPCTLNLTANRNVSVSFN
jgi:Bacterial Ig-like domain (group 2)